MNRVTVPKTSGTTSTGEAGTATATATATTTAWTGSAVWIGEITNEKQHDEGDCYREGKGKQKKILLHHSIKCIKRSKKSSTLDEFVVEMIAIQFIERWHKYIMNLFVG